MDFGIGTLGIMPKDFWDITFADLVRLREAFYYKHHLSLDIARTEMANLRNSIPNFGKGAKKAVKPSELIKLPIDSLGDPPKKWTHKDIEEVKKIFEKDKKFLKLTPNQIGGEL